MAVRLPKAGEVAACSSWACGAGGRGGREGLQGGGVMVGWTGQGGPIGKEHRNIPWSPQYP